MPGLCSAQPLRFRRRIRRHHYQEGPGFLFLATQNSRPTEVAVARQQDRVRFRMRSVCFRAGVVMSSKMAREDLLEGTDQAGAPSLMPGAVDCVLPRPQLADDWYSPRLSEGALEQDGMTTARPMKTLRPTLLMPHDQPAIGDRP